MICIPGFNHIKNNELTNYSYSFLKLKGHIDIDMNKLFSQLQLNIFIENYVM